MTASTVDMKTSRKGIGTAIIAIVAVVVVLIGGTGLIVLTSQSHPSSSPSTSSSISPTTGSTTMPATTSQTLLTTHSQMTTTTTSSSCSGFPPGGDCLATYNYTFTMSVNYTGPWKLNYQGYNSLGESNPINVSGNDTGAGFFSKAVTLSGLNNNGLTLCATAQKLDGSNNPLILTITGNNETSLPYGSTSYCGSVAP